MDETMRALYAFFESFGLPAYPEGQVPAYGADGLPTAPPYITVQLVEPDWRAAAPMYAEVWTRSTSFEGINAIVKAIKEAIGEGVSLETESGYVWLFKGDTFCQYRSFPGDPDLKCAYLNLIIHALTE